MVTGNHRPFVLKALVIDAVDEHRPCGGRDSEGFGWFYVSPAGGFGSYAPGEATGKYRTGGDILLTDANGNSHISGADFATASVDEIEAPAHHRERFTVAT